MKVDVACQNLRCSVADSQMTALAQGKMPGWWYCRVVIIPVRLLLPWVIQPTPPFGLDT